MKMEIIPIRFEMNSSKNKENVRKCLDTTLWFKIPVIYKVLNTEILKEYLERRLNNFWYQYNNSN